MNHVSPNGFLEKRALCQNELFQNQILFAAANSPFYKALLKKHGVDPATISLQNKHMLPFTNKEDIQGCERALLCVSPEQVVEYVTTSGTLGSPVTFMLSEHDMDRLAQNEFESLTIAGVKSSDIIQIMVTLDKRFMAGMAYYLGARKIGAGIVRTGVESLDFQLDTLHRMKPTVLIAVPSFILKLIDQAKALGISLKDTEVRKIICIGEPIRRVDMVLNTLGQRIVDQWPVELHSTYASTEMATAFTECSGRRGGHHQADLIVAEILDPNGNEVEPGQPGELVVTPLGVEAMPLIRFRTGDICRQMLDDCGCGYKSMRIGPVEGRKKQMIKFKGTSLYPPALFDVLNGMTEINQYLVTLSSTTLGTDHVLVEYCSTTEDQSITDKLKEKFKSYIRVIPELAHIDPEVMRKKTFNSMSRKRVNLLDLRDK